MKHKSKFKYMKTKKINLSNISAEDILKPLFDSDIDTSDCKIVSVKPMSKAHDDIKNLSDKEKKILLNFMKNTPDYGELSDAETRGLNEANLNIGIILAKYVNGFKK